MKIEVTFLNVILECDLVSHKIYKIYKIMNIVGVFKILWDSGGGQVIQGSKCDQLIQCLK